MNRKNTWAVFSFGVGVLLIGMFVLTTQLGQAQLEDIVPHPEPILFADATDSWRVQVKNACLVDTVTVKSGSVPSDAQENFQTDKFTDDPNEAGGTAQGKAACANAENAARKALPGKLWTAGDNLCKEWEKAPPKKAGKECYAVRGNLAADTISCSCDFEPQDPKRDDTRKWRAKATCTAPDVKYVCDP